MQLHLHHFCGTPIYRMGGKLYGQPNSITGPLVLGGILKSQRRI
jgi:hypothetical protein